ncbi:MAG TPA: sigma-70 family RNA polymerase sigma factor [Mesorhizobium sp.]|nr:sigma-70 family RNA polymerase sigma factor [Mesorhizobium sp.]HEV2503743.1 sigma-70 family RNA polymerase sigma factor [Mesorhizobium sp.]
MTEISSNLRDDASIVELVPAFRAFARTFCRNPNDADDLVQETLVKALNSFDSFEPNTRLKSWMFTIMRNTFYKRIKVYIREAPGSIDCVAARPRIEATQEWSVRGREIHEAINRLPQPYREVLMLAGVMGESYEETAKICGCAVGTVKSRLNRARQHLLEELGETSPDTLMEQSKRFSSPLFQADDVRRGRTS